MGASPKDQDVRDRLIHDLDATFFVEAGAGTGKTTTVVRRIAQLVAKGRLEIKGLVAITFTEAAAAELRVRVREELESTARQSSRPDEEGARCRSAIGSIEDATIDTIHAFAAYILRTFPLDAGVPPGFEVMESIQEQLEFHDRFRAWFDQVGKNKGRQVVARSLFLGLQPKHIRDAAQALQEHYDLLEREMVWPSASRNDALEVAHDLGRRLTALMPLLNYGPGAGQATWRVQRVQPRAQRMIMAETEEDALRGLLETLSTGGITQGNQGEWQRHPDTGENVFRILKAEWKAIMGEADELIEAYRRNNLAQLLSLLSDFLLDWADIRKREGRATFHDLLTWARDAVRDKPDVRRRLRERFTRIFVDEFQDTDPLQAELVMYLAAQPGEPLPPTWQEIDPVPGKLFIVGDPKQSIYRFRRADIALYQTIQDRLGHLEKLSSNFRSVSSIIDWVNEHFSQRIQESAGAQPSYSHLRAEREEAGTAIWSFGGLIERDQGAVWQAEAEGVAAAARQAVDSGWQVSDDKAGAGTRRATYSDITLLIPSRTNLAQIQRAFEAADVPYRLESGELVLATQEVRDLLACLRSMDDPSDQVALVTALRSPIYGCSDVDLLRWVEGGGLLNYDRLTAEQERTGPIGEALADLNRWHHQRHEMGVAALLELFIDQRMLAVATLANRRPQDYLRRYKHIVERARTFATTGRTTLRSFLDWMDDLRDENQAALPGPPEGGADDAVRVMTVHGCKGLEFPIVIMTGWHSKRNFRSPGALADRNTGRIEVACGEDRLFKTAGYDSAVETEKALNDAELIRLIYVAATRAKNHLVVSLFRRDEAREASYLAKSVETFDQREHLESAVPGRLVAAGVPSAAGGEAVGVEDEAIWVARRTQVIQDLRGPRLTTATGLAHLADQADLPPVTAEPDGPVVRRGRGATSLGRAVHAVLQVIDLASLDRLDELSQISARAEGIPHRWSEVSSLARSAAESPAVRRAVTSGVHWREVPIGVTLGETILEGYIDLVFQSPDGLEIVDYKTDNVSNAEIDGRMTQYAQQGEAYRAALEMATGLPIPRVTFVFAQTGGERVIDPDPERRRQLIGAASEVRSG
jgi:ATP-dependent helicase/nuclease subunit A